MTPTIELLNDSVTADLTVAAGVLSFAGAAQAQTIPLHGSGTGQVILQINPTPQNPVGLQVYDGQGQQTMLGNLTAVGLTFFTADGSVNGVFVATAADGATITGSYSGSFTPIDATTVVFEVETVSPASLGNFVRAIVQATAGGGRSRSVDSQ